MQYSFNKIVEMPFDDAVNRVIDELKKEGFGVLTDIDVQTTLKKKLGVDFKKYRILGACNPHFAYKALQAESRIGTMLPCNVIVQEIEQGCTKSIILTSGCTICTLQNRRGNMAAFCNKTTGRITSKICWSGFPQTFF